jgi:hypothetical protein
VLALIHIWALTVLLNVVVPAKLASAARSGATGQPVGVGFDTVTVTTAESPMLPAVSTARACRWCVPSTTVRVSHTVSNGASESTASSSPSSRNCTARTPPGSDALAATVMVPDTVAPLLGEVTVTVGGVESPGGGGEAFATVTVTTADSPMLPTVS